MPSYLTGARVRKPDHVSALRRHNSSPFASAPRIKPTERTKSLADAVEKEFNGNDRLDAVTVDGLQALGGHVQRDGTAFRGQVKRATLDIWVPATARAAVRVGHGLTEAWLAARDLAMCRHGLASFSSAAHALITCEGGTALEV